MYIEQSNYSKASLLDAYPISPLMKVIFNEVRVDGNAMMTAPQSEMHTNIHCALDELFENEH